MLMSIAGISEAMSDDPPNKTKSLVNTTLLNNNSLVKMTSSAATTTCNRSSPCKCNHSIKFIKDGMFPESGCAAMQSKIPTGFTCKTVVTNQWVTLFNKKLIDGRIYYAVTWTQVRSGCELRRI